MSDAEQIEGIARAMARGEGLNYDTLFAGPRANFDSYAKSAYHHMIDTARAAADQLATEALRERAVGAASKALEWLETEPHGDLAANSARAGLIAGQAAVDAVAATLARRAEALRELLDEALLWVPGHVHAHFLARRTAALADTPAPGWREYTVEPDVPDGVMVLCRSEEACEEHIPNPADRHLTLGEAADWAQAHAARHRHEEAAAAADVEPVRRSRGPAVFDVLAASEGRNPWSYRDDPAPHTVWDHYGPCGYCGVTVGPCLNPDPSVKWPGEGRTPAPKPHPRRPVRSDSGRDPAPPPAVDCPLPPCSGKAGRWCTGTDDDVPGYVHEERERLVFAPTIRRGGQPMPPVPDMHDLFAAPELADGPTVPHPAECRCPNEVGYGADCPLHKPDPDACQRCGGLMGNHIFRDCPGLSRRKES